MPLAPMRLPRRRSMVSSRPSSTGPFGAKASSNSPSSTRAAARPPPGGGFGRGVVFRKPPLPAEPGDPEDAGHRAPARRQDGPDQQHLGVPPTPLAKKRREAQDHRGEAGWQARHGGCPFAGAPPPNPPPPPPPQPAVMAKVEVRNGWPSHITPDARLRT